jgi:enoyl-CoA hydratase/carnithine racemase
MTSVVNTWTSGPLLWVEIDRPGALNAINFEVMDALEAALVRFNEERDLRAMILRGAGSKAFISGGDLKEFAPLKSHEDAAAMAERMHEILSAFELIDGWVIACINGAAFGGGCETLLAADFRVASSDATLGFTQTRFGVPCGWGGMTRLTEHVGRTKTMKWLARSEILDATRAQEEGLVDEIFAPGDLVEQTEAFALSMCNHSREMIEALKHMSIFGRELPRSAALAAEIEPFAELWASDEHHRRVEAFLARDKTASPRGSES